MADVLVWNVDVHDDEVMLITTLRDSTLLHRIDVETGEIKSEGFDDQGYIGLSFGSSFDWDGKQSLVFRSSRAGNEIEGFVEYDLMTKEALPIPAIDTLQMVSYPQYSPSGDEIFFYSSGIQVYSKRDSSVRTLYSNFSEPLLPKRWSSDGKWIYATTESRITGQKAIKVAKVSTVNGDIVSLAEIPVTDSQSSIEMSPSGAYGIMNVRHSKSSDIYMLEHFDPEVE